MSVEFEAQSRCICMSRDRLFGSWIVIMIVVLSRCVYGMHCVYNAGSETIFSHALVCSPCAGESKLSH